LVSTLLQFNAHHSLALNDELNYHHLSNDINHDFE
jgi:hypothetical protein